MKDRIMSIAEQIARDKYGYNYWELFESIQKEIYQEAEECVYEEKRVER